MFIFLEDSHYLKGTWIQVHAGKYLLPDQSNTEATFDVVFYSHEVHV